MLLELERCPADLCRRVTAER